MLKGAHPSDTLSFDIMIRKGRHSKVIKQQRLRGTQQVSLDVELSRWKGKTVQLILRVHRLKGAKRSPAVWVNPIFVTK